MKALLVDLYDTLVWTDWRALGQLLAARLGVDGATLLRAFETTSVGRGSGHYGSVRGDLAAIVAAAGGQGLAPTPGSADEAFLAALETELLGFLKNATHLYEDVRPVLRAVRASGTRVAIVSNCDHATRPLLESLGLAGDVDATVLSFEVASLKPHAAIFEHALARLGVGAEDAVFIDDQPRFLDGARALGMRTLQITRTPGFAPPAAAEPHPLIADLTQLVP